MDPATDTEVDQEDLEIEAYSEQLLQGIPDHLTLREIITKLPWKSLCSLAEVNPAWLHAMKNGEIYDARVFYRALDSLVILRHYPEGSHWYWDGSYWSLYEILCLYSTRDGLCFELPPLPDCVRGIPRDCQCVKLESKIYALHLRHVYALDLAGPERQWKQCAHMLQPEKYFRCVPLNGKIYALEDQDNIQIGGELSEVYDPKEDTWSFIQPGPYRPRYEDAFVTTVGEEVIILSSEYGMGNNLEYTADIYHPVKDEWRVVRLLPPMNELKSLFCTQGKLYEMQNGCIFVLEMDTGRWMLRHHYSFAGLGLSDEESHLRNIITSVGDELLAILDISYEMRFVQSEGFGGKNRDITWHECKLPTQERHSAMYPIQL